MCAALQQFIFYQSGLITPNMSGPSIPNSPLVPGARVSRSHQQRRAQHGESKPTTSVRVYENMINPLSQRRSECVTLLRNPPPQLCMGPPLTDPGQHG